MNLYSILEHRVIINIIKYTPFNLLHFLVKTFNELLIIIFNKEKYLITKKNLKIIFPYKTDSQLTAIVKKNSYEELRYFLDLGILMHKPEDCIRTNVSNKITILGTENLTEALTSDKGVFLVSAHFACFYYMLLAKIPELAEINILKAFNSSERENLYDKLENLTNKKINGIYIKDKFASMRTYKKLKSKKLVACMFDNFFLDTTLVSADFLGRPALASAGVTALAIRSNAVLLPAFIVRSETGYILKIDKMIDSKKYVALSTNDQIVKLTMDLNQAVENCIIKYPHQWQAWTTLDRRWDLLDG